MPQGHVKWFDKKKGYGFISHDESDIFIHYSEVVDQKYIPENNDLVSFDLVPGEKGLKAKNITKAG